jgi:hypothetical protein
LEEIIFEIFNISENNIISVKPAKVVRYLLCCCAHDSSKKQKKRYTHTSYFHIHHRVLIVSSTPPTHQGFFFLPILQYNQIGDPPQEDLTKFGYTQDIKK